MDALEDFTLRILIVASIVSIAIQVGTATPDHRSIAWIEGAAIIMAVTVVSMVTSINDYKKESQFIALNKFNDSKNVITVKREGTEIEVNFDDLKCGDLARIKTGMQIPCDAILVPESSGVLTDEAAMTGESDEMKKDTPEQCMVR